MEKNKLIVNHPVKVGHGAHRAKKTNPKENKDLKHEKKWIDQKIDNV
jgi:hypothetical protein